MTRGHLNPKTSSLARRERITTQPRVTHKRRRRERRERGVLRNRPSQQIVREVYVDQGLPVLRKHSRNLTRDLIVVDCEVVDLLQVSKARGNGACQTVPTHVKETELRHLAYYGWHGTRELVVGKVEVRQSLQIFHLSGNPACELVASQVETLQTLESVQRRGNCAGQFVVSQEQILQLWSNVAQS